MELIPGVTREGGEECGIYYIHNLSEEFKQEIRNQLVKVCHGESREGSLHDIYSYKETLKDFIHKYQEKSTEAKNRQKGLIGELLVHILIGIEDKFLVTSAFFNLEENSFKKGFDITLYDKDRREIWITEIKSGEKQARHKTPSTSMVALINKAKKHLTTHLDGVESRMLWLNAINHANNALKDSRNEKKAILDLLERMGSEASHDRFSFKTCNVILVGVLFHSMSEQIIRKEIEKKFSCLEQEQHFKKVLVMAIQKATFNAVYEFMKSEVENEG